MKPPSKATYLIVWSVDERLPPRLIVYANNTGEIWVAWRFDPATLTSKPVAVGLRLRYKKPRLLERKLEKILEDTDTYAELLAPLGVTKEEIEESARRALEALRNASQKHSLVPGLP